MQIADYSVVTNSLLTNAAYLTVGDPLGNNYIKIPSTIAGGGRMELEDLTITSVTNADPEIVCSARFRIPTELYATLDTDQLSHEIYSAIMGEMRSAFFGGKDPDKEVADCVVTAPLDELYGRKEMKC